ncbi:MAG: Coenzyme F420 hydrogenase/dehydrogenase, beta subunit C-terminal domain [Clostridia bacterium]|nr:Coenzyme F420 hydrogenase/dehydrogenase, beta subunit C-terminal domain [Clostridia bacterium]
MRTTVRANKAECTGCGACASICPKGAITMKPDEEGFLYPAVDASLCIECDACEKRCPVGKELPQSHMRAMGAQNKDEEIRRQSSSGGVFTALAQEMFARGGVVFGAAFDEKLHLEHIGAMNEGELAPMRGSKYVQSSAAEAISHAVSLLGKGIPVLFSGTPCQVAGMKAAAGSRREENLLTVDFVCHGVPSPGVFASYISELEKKHGKRVTAYTFRDKRNGWKDFSAVATFEDGSEHAGGQKDEPYLYGFLQNLYLRPSCAQCDALRGNRHLSDITIADLWGAQEICPQHDDDTGLSLVLVHTRKGQDALERVKSRLHSFSVLDLQKMLRYNPSIEHTAKAHEKRRAFFARYRKKGFESERVLKLLAGPGLAERIVRRIAHLPWGLARRIRALFNR